ncbi:porin [Alkalilimnicola ehrlichii MLHE-1]|uniref:Porin, Gram-negative type n=1 Tax=Alkalilimnicola ehrlichii (strain ATCC BAA-1101 / DSM 17681 / MLHE-1) TaxID=187272 RepID=Q0A7F2_ALKEH|nr:porin [Alkalilimnicola ehrlichii]ABI57235.1 porin, Gram-negative type [Alkalilimnicola ehrlichii MLHE-1]
MIRQSGIRFVAVGGLSLLVALPAVAQPLDWPELYGRLHLSADVLNNGDGTSRHLSDNSSRLGLRGQVLLDDDRLRAVYQVEIQAALNEDDSSDELTLRNTFAGLEGPWGLLRAGRIDTPVKRMRSNVDPFSDSVGDARNILRLNTAAYDDRDLRVNFDRRLKNSLNYTTPRYQGLGAQLHYSADAEGDGSASDNDDEAWSAMLDYERDATWVGLGYERYRAGETPTIWRVAASQGLGDWRLTGLYQSTRDPDSWALGGSVTYAFGVNRLLAQVYTVDARDGDDLDATMYALGAERFLADSVRVYLRLAWLDNDDEGDLTPYRQSRSADPEMDTPGEDPYGVSVGLRIDF